MDDARLATLIYDLTVLLKLFERDLTAYHQVFEMVEHEAKTIGVQLNIQQALQSLTGSAALVKEVGVIYAPLDTLAQSMTPENLDSAIFEIQRIQKQRGVVRVNLPQTESKGPIQ